MKDKLIMALADPVKQAKLRTICIVLNSLGTCGDYTRMDELGKPTRQRYIDMVTISDMPLGRLYDKLFKR